MKTAHVLVVAAKRRVTEVPLAPAGQAVCPPERPFGAREADPCAVGQPVCPLVPLSFD
jgi:hypothetical protein